jgi:hypothetical protein
MWALLGVIVDGVLEFAVAWWLWLRDPPVKGDRR